MHNNSCKTFSASSWLQLSKWCEFSTLKWGRNL